MTAACKGNHPKNEHGNQLYCLWCEKILGMYNEINELRREVKTMKKKPTPPIGSDQQVKPGFYNNRSAPLDRGGS